MIRPEAFTVSRETFAAERKEVLGQAAEELRPHIAEALNRLGLPSWEQQIVQAALDVFDETARAEVDEWSPIMDDMRDLFAKELGDALEKTKTASNRDHQLETITNWVAQMAHNAGMEAATTSDPDGNVGLEWVTMGDGDVREPHQEANGQQVPTGQEFEVGGEKMLYPGQPVGDPSNWINCRCLARPTMLGEMAGRSEEFGARPTSLSPEYVERLKAAYPEATHPWLYSNDEFAGEGNASDPGVEPGEEPKAAVIVLRPRVEDPITAIASGTHPHCTLLYLGDSTVNLEPLKQIVEGVAQSIGHPMTDKVSGRAVLGEDKADVLLVDASGSSAVRAMLMENDGVLELLGMQEQFPAWIPHLTIGYPDAPAEDQDIPEDITYDLLSIWRGNETYDYPLGEPMPKEDDAAPAPAEATASVEDETPVPAPPAETGEAEPAAEQFRPWHGVLAPEAALSGDQREFFERALKTRNLPLPLKAMFIDDQGHKGSVVVGRIDEIFRDKLGNIRANGVYDNSPEADRAWMLVENKMWRGVSVDIDAAIGTVTKGQGEYGKDKVSFNEGRICAATMCSIPAFAEAYVRNGRWEDYANEPEPTGEMVEIPDWPEDVVKETEAAPVFSLVASAAPAEISADFFRNPNLTEPTPVTRGEDGHIFGHLATWDTCHIGYSELCVTPPPSETDYSFFLTGQVFTDAGAVAVGQLTVGGGHAPDGISIRAAIAHYDNVSTAVADVTCGEDEFGVWFSGRIRPWATEQQIHELFAAGPSGDWREVRARGRSSMEMCAAHAVNVPGYAVPRPRFAVKEGRTTSLVAAGAVPPRPLSADAALERAAATLATELRFMEFDHINKQFSTLKGS